MIVKFETAKLAKEKGFHAPQIKWYNKQGVFKGLNDASSIEPNIYAPTQSELQTWIYETHSIWVSVQPLFSANEQIGIHLSITSWKFPPIVIEEDDEFDMYKGFEKVLFEALKIIKNQNNGSN